MSDQPELPRDQHSQMLRRRLRDAVEVRKANRQELGELLCFVQEHGFWRDWGYADFRACIRQEFELGVRTAQELINVQKFAERLRLPRELVPQLGWSKVAVVAPIATAENANAILNDLKKLSLRQLRSKYKLSHAGAEIVAPVTVAVSPEAMAPTAEWRRPKPPDEQFYIPQAQWDALCYALHYAENVLLLGHSGCGKTELCDLLAQACEKELQRFNCGAMTEARSALIGNTHLDRDNGTRFQPSRFVAAIQNSRSCVLLDELSRAPRDAFNILLPVLDHQRYLALDESADAGIVQIAAGVNLTRSRDSAQTRSSSG